MPPKKKRAAPAPPDLSAVEAELEIVCQRWGVDYRRGSAAETTGVRATRHKLLKNLCTKAKQAHLSQLQAAGRARVDVAHYHSSLAGKIVSVLQEHKQGGAIRGLVVRAGEVAEPVEAHLLLSVSPEETDAPMPDAPEPAPPSSPIVGAIPRRTESGGYTHLPGFGRGGSLAPPWLRAAWRARFPTRADLDSWKDALVARDPAAPHFARTPLGTTHPPGCTCGRLTCPCPASPSA